MLTTTSTYLATKILERKVLTTGKEFKLNSGELSSFYYDFGKFSDSLGLVELGFSYYRAIIEFKINFDIIIGVAYKGIIPALATCNYFFTYSQDTHFKNIPYTILRKETKDHGEGGNIIGSDISDKRVLLLDDVYTTGKALSRAIAEIEKYNPKSISILVALNRNINGNEEDLIRINNYSIYSITSHKTVLSLMK